MRRPRSSRGTGELIAAAVDAGAAVVLVAAGGSATTDGGAGAIEAIEEAGGLRGARLVVLTRRAHPVRGGRSRCSPRRRAQIRTPSSGCRAAWPRLARKLPRDPRGVPGSGAAGGLAGGLWAKFGARLEPGAPFVLGALGFDERMRAARVVVVGEGRLDWSTMHGKAVFEIATRARQGGVPCHAIVGEDGLDLMGHRIMDLQTVTAASTVAELEAAGEALAERLAAAPVVVRCGARARSRRRGRRGRAPRRRCPARSRRPRRAPRGRG